MYPPQGYAALLEEALVVYKGTTTSAGAGDGSTLVCSDLTSKADWNGNQVIVTSGDYKGQARNIKGVTTLGTVTPANAFSGQIVAGVTFVITGIRTVPAEVAACLAILKSDSRRILSTTLTAPTVNSLTKFIASGGTALGTTLGASKSLVDAIGADGVDALSHDFSEAGLMQYAHGTHITTYILFVIPEAVASISTHNTAIKTSLEKLGRVIAITQADALSYPDFNTYTLCVLGSNNGTAWTTSNLAHLKEISDVPIVCCDSVSAAYLEMGTANANVTSTKALFGVANIEGSIVGTGLHGRTGLAIGTQDIADANTTFASLDMSDVDITEVYYGYESSDDNAHVLLGKIRYIQPDGTIGMDKEGAEIPGSRYFYGPAYSYDDLNTLGKDAFEILVLGFIHSKTIGHSIAISGELRSLEKVLFGNLKNKFSNSNPLAKFIGTGGTGLGQPLPASTSLIDLLGNFTGPYNGVAQDDNVKASLDLAHTDLDAIITDIGALNDLSADQVRQSVCLTGDPGSSIGKILYDLYITRVTAARATNLDEINAVALAQDAGSVASNAQVDSLLRAVADIVRSGGSGDLAAILADVTGINGEAMRGTDNAALAATALTDVTWTDAKAAFLDEAISAAKTLTVAERTAIRKSVCLTGDTASSIGKILYDLNARATEVRLAHLNADISSRSSHNAAAVWSVGTRALTDKASFTLDSGEYTNIWNKDISAYSGAGYGGAYLKTLYDDWLNDGRLDLLIDSIITYVDCLPASLGDLVTKNLAHILSDSTAFAGADIATIKGQTDTKDAGRPQVFVKSITSAANAGDVAVATITTQPCIIDSIVLHADTASQTDLTSAAISGGASKVVAFIDATDAAKANIDAIDEQVAWTGAVRLAATKTITISLVGGGVTAVDLTVIITYHAEVDGGYLS